MIEYLAGILIVALLPDLSWAPLLMLALLPFRHCKLKPRIIRLFLGVVVATLWGQWQLSHRLPDSAARATVVVSGEIDSIVTHDWRRQRFSLNVDDVEAPDRALQRLRHIQLSYYQHQPAFKAGQQVRLRVRLFPPHGYHDDFVYDSERKALLEGVDARGYIRKVISVDPQCHDVACLRGALYRLLHHNFNDPRVRGTLTALVLGIKDDLSYQDRQLASQSGTAHLLVVSGMHLAIIAGVLMFLGQLLAMMCRAAGFGSRWIMPVLVITGTAGYMWLAGAGVAVERAFVMVLVFAGAQLALRPVSGWQRWRIALVVVLTLKPLAILEAGLWLSFVAVALLLWISRQRFSHQRPWQQLLRVQLVLFIGMLLVNVVVFQRFSLAMPFLNFLLIPIASLFLSLLPVLLVAVLVFHADWAHWVISQAISGYWHLIGWVVEQGSAAVITVPPVHLTGLLLALIGVIVLLLPIPWRWRLPGTLCLLPVLFPVVSSPAYGEYQAQIFDIGQGLGSVIRLHGATLIYDTGPKYSSGGDAFSRVMAPYLRAHDVSRVDEAVISHADSDHSGGVGSLSAQFNVVHWILGQPLPDRLRTEQSPCVDGEKQQLDGVSLYFYQMSHPSNNNEFSCVLYLRSREGCSLLLMGDLDKAGERMLLPQLPEGPIDWLVVGHHGSHTSTSAALLRKERPRAAIISRGRFNRFHHPAADVVRRLKRSGAVLIDTALDGSVSLESHQKGCSIKRWRTNLFGYWHT